MHACMRHVYIQVLLHAFMHANRVAISADQQTRPRGRPRTACFERGVWGPRRCRCQCHQPWRCSNRFPALYALYCRPER